MHEDQLHGQHIRSYWPLRGQKMNTLWQLKPYLSMKTRMGRKRRLELVKNKQNHDNWRFHHDRSLKISQKVAMKFYKLRARGNVKHWNHYRIAAYSCTLGQIFATECFKKHDFWAIRLKLILMLQKIRFPVISCRCSDGPKMLFFAYNNIFD